MDPTRTQASNRRRGQRTKGDSECAGVNVSRLFHFFSLAKPFFASSNTISRGLG